MSIPISADLEYLNGDSDDDLKIQNAVKHYDALADGLNDSECDESIAEIVDLTGKNKSDPSEFQKGSESSGFSTMRKRNNASLSWSIDDNSKCKSVKGDPGAVSQSSISRKTAGESRIVWNENLDLVFLQTCFYNKLHLVKGSSGKSLTKEYGAIAIVLSESDEFKRFGGIGGTSVGKRYGKWMKEGEERYLSGVKGTCDIDASMKAIDSCILLATYMHAESVSAKSMKDAHTQNEKNKLCQPETTTFSKVFDEFGGSPEAKVTKHMNMQASSPLSGHTSTETVYKQVPNVVLASPKVLKKDTTNALLEQVAAQTFSLGNTKREINKEASKGKFNLMGITDIESLMRHCDVSTESIEHFVSTTKFSLSKGVEKLFIMYEEALTDAKPTEYLVGRWAISVGEMSEIMDLFKEKVVFK